MKLIKDQKIKPEFVMRDSWFGIYLDLSNHLPSGCSAMHIYVIKDGEKFSHGIHLSHQLTLENLMEWTENKKYQIFCEPHFPEFKPIELLEEK